MPLVETRGAASAQGFGEFAQVTAVNYIEEVFSTYLYTGNGASLTITNGIDLSTKGGLTWFKQRNLGRDHVLEDTVRGAGNALFSNSTNAQSSAFGGVSSYGTTGFTLDGNASEVNANTGTYVSWTFRKQPKFFDVVTYTGTYSIRTVSHNLGSVPGCIIIKATSAAGDNWSVYHRSIGASGVIWLNLTNAASTSGRSAYWNDTAPTSTQFTVGADGDVNGSGVTYVAYLFAHDAGGFGATGTDNVISCGSATVSGNATSVTLGYEPQWVMMKRTSGISDWFIVDNMRGFSSNGSPFLRADTTDAESANTGTQANATGFTSSGVFDNGDYIYIAVRRGPMAVPTVGTSVFIPITSSATTGTALTTTFPVDMQIAGYRTIVDSGNRTVVDRLRGVSSTTTSTGQALLMSSTATETSASVARNWGNTGFEFPSYWSGDSTIFYSFRRAPSFFDVVCYTGTSNSVGRTVNHNLTVVPELMIVKDRSAANSWVVYVSPLGNTSGLILNGTQATITGRPDFWDSTTPTTSVFSVGSTLNANTVTWVAYLFATCAGVSKVGSYTGNGTTQTINCGFTGGARFVLIKRTDAAGDWYTYDTARGMTVLTDPYLFLNTTAAEVATLGSVTTVSTGFALNSAILADINVSAGSYIFLAVA